MFSSNRRINRLGHVLFFSTVNVIWSVFQPVIPSKEGIHAFPHLPSPGRSTPCHYRENGNPPVADAVYPVRYEKAGNTSDFALSLISVYERA